MVNFGLRNAGTEGVLLIFEDAEDGVPPKRIIRVAPFDAPVIGFGNPPGVTFDSRTKHMIIANYVTQPRLYAFD